MGKGKSPDNEKARLVRHKLTPMDRFWREWGGLVKALGAKGFQDFCKECGGMVVPTYAELLNIGKSEIIRDMIVAGATLGQIKYMEKLGSGKVLEILKEIEKEGERERKAREGTDEYGD